MSQMSLRGDIDDNCLVQSEKLFKSHQSKYYIKDRFDSLGLTICNDHNGTLHMLYLGNQQTEKLYYIPMAFI